MVGFVANLPVGEAQWGEAGGREGLVTYAIPRLLGRGAVVLQAVGLYDEA